MAADVVGYSRLMETNEERTLGALRQHRREFFDPIVARHKGRIFKVMGDGFLVEFGSVIDAARCAVEIQTGMPERNAGVPEDRHIKFRIGINLGDVIVDGDDFYGDGVNMAARLEGLAMPGGIACSAVVRNQVRNKIEVEFLDQGEKTVKNIAQPVHVYFINMAAPANQAAHVTGAQPAARTDKPSVAILPFINMSNDPEQEFFSDGITEDIITDLSKVSGLFVLGRSTVFACKGQALDLVQVARRFGVSYLVEGSVRKAGNRVRINAQLIEGATGGHVWADRYDRDLTDIFEVQDEITKTIVEQLKVTLLPEEKKAIEQAPTASAEAYLYCLKARELYYRYSRSSLSLAKVLFEKAVAVDPFYALAYAGLAACKAALYSIHSIGISSDQILAAADKALALDASLAEAHVARGLALMVGGNRAEAADAFERALTFDPNCYEAHLEYCRFSLTSGEYEASIKHGLRALEIQPGDWAPVALLAQAYLSIGNIEQTDYFARLCLKRIEATLQLHPDDSPAAIFAANGHAYFGNRERALECLAQAFAPDPEDNFVRYNAACVYAILGEFDLAIDLLEIYLPLVGPDRKLLFKNDSDLDPIRSHPRYQKLLDLAGSLQFRG